MTNSNASHSVSHRHATNESSSNVSSKLFITALIIELTTLAFTHVHRRWIEVEEKKETYERNETELCVRRYSPILHAIVSRILKIRRTPVQY